jgi:peptidoglycan/xylan/chitin deacetylase (PgdA/CDA1 family)
MSLLVLMYHRARPGRDGNSAEMLERHFRHIAAHCRNVLPGDALAAGAPNVCLSFDDGYFDFQTVVFPLLRKFGLRALLAISPAVLREWVEASPEERLAVPTEECFIHPRRGGFCTWPELQAMADSGHVAIAAHGYTHARLDLPAANLATEVHLPKIVLDSRLPRPTESFVFPFGRYSRKSLEETRTAYRYVFRIGSAANQGWDDGLLYRICADGMSAPSEHFSSGRMAIYRARFFWNRLRGK